MTMFGYEIDQRIPCLSDMPLLEEFLERHRPERPLEGVTGLFIQHQLGNQVPMVEALIALGLDPRRIIWLDVPYTASSRVRHHLIDRCGIPEENFWVNRYRVLDPYGSYQRRRVQELVRDTLASQSERVIVLDDGAYFVSAAATFRKRLRHVAVVEQTTRGLIRIGDSPALRLYSSSIPIVNVAGSTPKLDLESPWIGVAIASALRHHLDALRETSDFFDLSAPVLVLGYGAIGQSVARALGESRRIHVFDPDSERATLARAHGFDTWNQADFDTQFGLVVGCTGRSSFGVGDYVYLADHAVLASASSASVEFSRAAFIDLAATSGADDISIDRQGLHEDQIHKPLLMHLVDRDAIFLNGGFPINFDGRVNCVPSRYIQPTALVMVQGALQAVGAGSPGCIQLDRQFCNWLDESFRASLDADEARWLPATATTEPRKCW